MWPPHTAVDPNFLAVTSKNVPKHCQMSCRRQNHPQFRITEIDLKDSSCKEISWPPPVHLPVLLLVHPLPTVLHCTVSTHTPLPRSSPSRAHGVCWMNNSCCWMTGWIHRWIDGWMGGQMDIGWVDK